MFLRELILSENEGKPKLPSHMMLFYLSILTKSAFFSFLLVWLPLRRD